MGHVIPRVNHPTKHRFALDSVEGENRNAWGKAGLCVLDTNGPAVARWQGMDAFEEGCFVHIIVIEEHCVFRDMKIEWPKIARGIGVEQLLSALQQLLLSDCRRIFTAAP
jgi:hypothetical protein